MGRADSPLRGRVIFTEGAPRSGTTLLASLLASHPDVAGTVAESHLFDRGVDALFANHAMRGRHQGFLANYVSSDELIDLVRDLCDGVLVKMRDRVKPEAGWVSEKTPAPAVDAERVLRSKRDVYPDAHYVHVVRERDAVVRSLLRAPWNPRDEGASAEWWRASVAAIRAAFGDSDRYLEVRYEDLAADPVTSMNGLLEGLGLRSDPEIATRIESLSRERISSFGPEPVPPGPGSSTPAGGRRLGTRLLRRLRAPGAGGRASRVVQRLIVAARAADADAVARLTREDFELLVRSDAGDLRRTGEAGRAGLIELCSGLFARQFMTEKWTLIGEGPVLAVLLAAAHGDGSRVDACFAATVVGGRVGRLAPIILGAGGGRVAGEWSPPAAAGTPGASAYDAPR